MSLRNNGYQILLGDIGEILRRHKKTIMTSALGLALIAFSLGVTRDVLYLGEATFRDKAKADSGVRQSMSDFFLGSGEKNDSEAVSAMRSARLMEELIRRRGLQGTVNEKTASFPLLRTIQENLRVEWAYLMKKKVPALPEKEKVIAIADIQYHGELYIPLELTFLDETTYQVKEGSEGQLGHPYVGDTFRFTLNKVGGEPLEGRTFLVRLDPLKNVAKDLAQVLIAKTDSDDRSLIRIKNLHPDRQEAAQFVNTLMEIYQDYLRQEHDRIAKAQLTYLETRENEIALSLKKVMEDHATSLQNDLVASGFTDSKKELEFLTGQLLQFTHKLTEIELDQKRLARALEGDFASFDPSARGTADAPIINEMLQKMRELKMGQESLVVALADKEVKSNASDEYLGVGLQTAKEIYVALSRERQENDSTLKQLDFVLKELVQPEFEITSLTALLHDPVSQEKIMKASNLSHSLKDTSNRTQRELERIKEELRVQKEFFKTHLAETAKLLELKGQVLDEKFVLLQLAMLEMSGRDIAVLESQLHDYIATRMNNLKVEKRMLESELISLKERLAHIPEKWVKDQLLEQHLQRTQRMVENISSMVESKNISNNLELIQSAPLDFALVPLHPKPPRLILLTIIGAFLGTLFSSLFFVSKSLLTAIPLTLDNLTLNGFKTVGSFTYKKGERKPPLFDANFDTLRKALAYFPAHHLSLINLTGQGPDYADMLADLLRKKGDSVLRLHLTSQPEGTTGLKECLEEHLPVDAAIQGDTLYLGHVDRFANELFTHDRFNDTLHELKHRYSWIVASSDVPLNSPEAENLIARFDAALLAIQDETYQTLQPLLIDLEDLRREKPIAFLRLQSL